MRQSKKAAIALSDGLGQGSSIDLLSKDDSDVLQIELYRTAVQW